MYRITFYTDKRGYSPVAAYIQDLARRTDKDSRIKLNKIRAYLNLLREKGTRVGEPTVKHLDGDIWELRPLSDRILFAAWNGNEFLILSHFVKKSQKTPAREIKRALYRLTESRKERD